MRGRETQNAARVRTAGGTEWERLKRAVAKRVGRAACGCAVWSGYTRTDTGTPLLNFHATESDGSRKQRTVQPSHVLWMESGRELPPGHELHLDTSKCRDKLCVLPEHRRLVPIRVLPKPPAALFRELNADPFAKRVGPPTRVEGVDPSIGPCRPWLGPTDRAGYGSYAVVTPADGEWCQGCYAHQAAYIIAKGDIPASVVVAGERKEATVGHLCDNPTCVEPAHLRIETQSDQVKQTWSQGRRSTEKQVETK